MARGKKKESTLTLEEKLAQVLVPEDEQPYKVPENWCWTALETVASLYNGDRGVNYPSKKDYVEIGIPFINAGAIQNNALDASEFNYITEQKYEALRAGKIQRGDILYCLRGSLGKTAVVDSDSKGAISSSLCILRRNEAILLGYFAYLLQSEVIHKQQDGAENGSAQPNLSAASVLRYMIPLAPLTEQQRIVDRIESMFAKLDEAKEKAQSVLDSFEIRKAAILHQAFTGELTVKWRAEHSVHADTWKCTTLSNVVSGFKYGSSEKSAYNNQGMPVLRIPNIGDNGVDFSDLKYLTHNDVEEESQIHEGDILIIRSNGSRDLVGKSVLVPPLDQPYAYASFLIRIKPSAAVNAEYLTKYLNSADARSQMFRKAKSSAGINNINSKELGAISLTLPTVLEQTEIARILDSLFAKEQQAKEAAEAVLEKIDLLKKSILTRAFRGELGTNDPTEESAVELLKSIL